MPSQYDIAELFVGGRNKRPSVASWETGRNEPPTLVIKKIAEAWGIPLQWFYDGKDTAVPPPAVGVGPAPPGGNAPAPLHTRSSQPGVGRRYFPIVGRAGAAAHPIEPGEADDFMEFSDDLTDRNRAQFVIQVWGDSAEPEFRHGDWILVTKEPNFTFPNFFCVICNPTHEYLVKLSKRTSTPRGGSEPRELGGNPQTTEPSRTAETHRTSAERYALEFHAINPAYAPVILEEGWEMIGFVVGWKRERAPGSYIEAGERTGLRPGFRE